jgi:periplasmic divalent cation tolerance protein
VIKTTVDRVDVLQQRIKELHSYELPEFIVIELSGGSEAYLQWVATEVQP